MKSNIIPLLNIVSEYFSHIRSILFKVDIGNRLPFIEYSSKQRGAIMDQLTALTVVLSISFILGYLLKRIGSHTMVGYILAGILVGPIMNIVNIDANLLDMLNELALSLIAFELGLLFPLKRFRYLKDYLVLNAFIFVLNLTLCNIVLSSRYAFPSILIASLYAFNANTIIGFKMLTEDAIMDEETKNLLIGVLSTSDLLALSILTIVPSLNVADAFSFSGLRYFLVGFITSFLSLGIMGIVIMKLVVSRLDDISDDLVPIFIISLLLIYLYISRLCGLSSFFGAFIIGMLFSSSSLSRMVRSQMKFVSEISIYLISLIAGLSFPRSGITLHTMFTSILLISILLLIKFLCTSLALWFSGLDLEKAVLLTIYLLPSSEFTIAIARQGFNIGIIGGDIYLAGVLALPLSLLLSNIVTPRSYYIASRISNLLPARTRSLLEESFKVIRDALSAFLAAWLNRSLFWLVIRKLTILSIIMASCMSIIKITAKLPTPISMMVFSTCTCIIAITIFITFSSLGRTICHIVLNIAKDIVRTRYSHRSREVILLSIHTLSRAINIWGATILTVTTSFSIVRNYLKYSFPFVPYIFLLVPLEVLLMGSVTYKLMKKVIERLEYYMDMLLIK